MLIQLLADESCDFSVVRALRAAGYDVKAVSDVAMGATDDKVLELAVHEQRVLLTEDKDFGQLVFAAAAATGGVIFIRYPTSARAQLPQVIVDLVREQEEALVGAFVVVQPASIRVSRG